MLLLQPRMARSFLGNWGYLKMGEFCLLSQLDTEILVVGVPVQDHHHLLLGVLTPHLTDQAGCGRPLESSRMSKQHVDQVTFCKIASSFHITLIASASILTLHTLHGSDPINLKQLSEDNPYSARSRP